MALSVRSHPEFTDPSLVESLVSEATIAQYFQVATVTVLVYDAIITMDKEVKYFWKTPRKIVTAVYFANRYVGLLGAIAYLPWNSFGESLALCKFSQWTRNISNWTSIVLIDYILMIRVLALYSQDEKLSIWLKSLLGLGAVSRLGIVIYGTLSEDIFVNVLTTDVKVCGQASTAPLEWGYIDWSIPMIYGVIVMVMALYKAAELWRISAGFKGLTLVKVLVQDQLIYFILAISCCVLNILEFKIRVSNAFLSAVLGCLGNATFLCVLGNRMLVNLKEAGERGFNQGTSYRTKSMSKLEFC